MGILDAFKKKPFRATWCDESLTMESIELKFFHGDEVVWSSNLRLSQIKGWNKAQNDLRFARIEKNAAKLNDIPQANAWYVLGCLPTKNKVDVEAAYRRMAQIYHPDKGGSSERFQALGKAKEAALKQCK